MNKEETTDELLSYFKYEHLPESMQTFSTPFAGIAHIMNAELKEASTCQLNDGLRKLLEAKDCFVRASLNLPKGGR